MNIEKALSSDADILTSLTLRSKSYWNYTANQIASWKEELTVSKKYIEDNEVFKLASNHKIIGFYAYNHINSKEVKLNFLFVDPMFIGKGFGKLLMEHFLLQVSKLNFESVTLDADPNAQKFYEQFNFEVVGQLKSSIKNRFLPVMLKKL